jgi:hypothetical protein
MLLLLLLFGMARRDKLSLCASTGGATIEFGFYVLIT